MAKDKLTPYTEEQIEELFKREYYFVPIRIERIRYKTELLTFVINLN